MDQEPQVLHLISAVQVFKQKLKNVLSEHQNAVVEVKFEGVAAASLVQNRNMEAELDLRRDVLSMKTNRREKEQHNHTLMRELQLVGAAPAPPPHRPLPLCEGLLWFSTEAPGGADGAGQQLRPEDQR